MGIQFSSGVLHKLEVKHGVTSQEVEEYFLNREPYLLTDYRECHKTEPPTLWFIANTNKGRALKICFISIDGIEIVKSAFEPNIAELRIYSRSSR
jgi:uncharacterized DUF497 family protein